MNPSSRNDELLMALGYPTRSSDPADPKWQLLALLRENTYRPLLPSDRGKSLAGSLLVKLAPDGSVASFYVVQLDIQRTAEQHSGSHKLDCVAWLPAGIPIAIAADASSLELSVLAD